MYVNNLARVLLVTDVKYVNNFITLPCLNTLFPKRYG